MSTGVIRQIAELSSFDAIADAAKGWDLHFRLLGSGSGTGTIEAVATGRALLQRNRFGWRLHQRGTSPRGFLTFGVGVDSDQQFPWCGQTVRDDWLLSFPTSVEYESSSDESFHGYSLTFDEDLVREVTHLLDLPSGAESLPPAGVFDVGRKRVTLIRDMVARVTREARKLTADDRTHGLARAIEWDLLVELLRAFAVGYRAKTPTVSLRMRALKRSTEYIEEADGRPLTVREVCEVSGVSWRTLDYAFKERYGVSPKAYLRARRLNAVRQALRDPEPARTVREVASRQGFWHMSQFAADYRKLFGELPSETLGRKQTGR